VTSENESNGASDDTHSGTRSPRRTLLLPLDLRPEHETEVMFRRAQWAQAMTDSWQMSDAIQMLNEMAMREFLDADPEDRHAMLRIRAKLEVISEFSGMLDLIVSEWASVEATREAEDAKRYGESV
jgi:hypothetical protein